MKIHLGPAGIPISCKGCSTREGISRVAELGLDAMEIEFVRGVHMGNEKAKEAGRVAKESNVLLSVHAPYYINLCNPEKVADSIRRVIASCERAFHMGAWIVVFHPGYYGKLSIEEAFSMVEKSCREMAEHIQKNKWDVLLGLETTGKHSQFGTLDEISKITESVKGCVPVVDWAHLYAKYGGRVDYGDIVRKMGSLDLERYHTHFSGINFTEKGERNHLPISSGKPDFSSVAGEVLGSGMKEITIISESPLLEEDSLRMKEVLSRLGYK